MDGRTHGRTTEGGRVREEGGRQRERERDWGERDRQTESERERDHHCVCPLQITHVPPVDQRFLCLPKHTIGNLR